jgi:hypothetical protein
MGLILDDAPPPQQVLKGKVVHYQVIAITGEIVATAKTKEEALQMAKIRSLSADRVLRQTIAMGGLG